MSHPDVFQALLSEFQPHLIVLVTLLFTLGVAASSSSMFESLYSYFWNSSHDGSDRRLRRKSTSAVGPRTRAQQLAAQRGGSSSHGGADAETSRAVHYPGLINISGTYCFLNSTLQALSSLSYLQPQVEASQNRAVRWEIETPVTDALLDTLNNLNTPHRTHQALRPVAVIDALSQPDPKGNRSRSRLFSSREHQDAQELFQLLSTCVQEEAADVNHESMRDVGLAEFDKPSPADSALKETTKNVFEGLTANRRSCVQCGYTEAVMHFSFDNLTLPVPRASSCRLEDCLEAYTHIEVLNDCVCRQCSMVATLGKLTAEVERLSIAAAEPGASSRREKKVKEAKRMRELVQQAINTNQIEQDLPGLILERVTSPASTKQAMIARPPPVLVLHLNRSSYFGYGHATKNSCQVIYPEILDLTPFTTSGALSVQPKSPISSHLATIPMTRQPVIPILYRLAAVVCHFGSHSFGHYITYRRKPRTSNSYPPFHPSRPRVPHSLTCPCTVCVVAGRIRDYDPDPDFVVPTPAGTGWLRISDDSVQEVGINSVLSEGSGTFMLYYERVSMDGAIGDQPQTRKRRSSSASRKAPPPPLHIDELKPDPSLLAMNASATSLDQVMAAAQVGMSSPRSSEETITPETARQTPGSPRPARNDVEETSGTPRATSLRLPDEPSSNGPIEFPKSARSSSTSARIVRNVSIIRDRSRTSSAASLSMPPTTRPRPPPLIIEKDPSDLPPGSSRTRARFTPPSTPKSQTSLPFPHVDQQPLSPSKKALKRKAKKAARAELSVNA